MKKRVAVVRVRGSVHLNKKIKDTLKFLNLSRINSCVVIDSRKEYLGMIKKVKDYVTWGEIFPETMKLLLEKRGLLAGRKKLTDTNLGKYKTISEFVKSFFEFKTQLKEIKIKPVFRLNPPRKGYERKGIKQPYSKGGALGYRGEKINELILRML